MLAWLIYDKAGAKRNKHYISIYFEECSKRNIDLVLLYKEDITIGVRGNKPFILHKGIEGERPDFVICRTIDPLLSRQLEIMGIRVFNNYKVSLICNNKQRTYQYISQSGIKVMDTIFADKNYSRTIEFPAVVKPARGRGGENVFLVESKNEYRSAIAKIQEDQIVIQKPASDLGRDLRVYVIGKRIIAAMLRVSDNDFRSNYSLGGSAHPYTLSLEQRETINKIIDIFDFGLVGIDFVFDKGQMVFNEIEDVVGSRMLYAKTNINIVSEYIDYIVQKVEIDF